MTRTMASRIAGFTFLFYIAAGIATMVFQEMATSGEGTAARLATAGAHPTELGIAVLLDLLCCFSALILAVCLYAITRDEDSDLAMLGLACRVGEGIIGAASIPKTLNLLWLAKAAAGSAAPDAATVNTLGTLLLSPAGSSTISATFFAVGSTVFSYLLARGRMVPSALAWFGVIASILLVFTLPLQLAGFLKGPITWYIWMPMLLFEVPLAFWLILKGAAKRD